MMVQQRRFGFRKAFVPLDTERALEVAREKDRYSRIQIVSLEPLPLSEFRLKVRTTGQIALDGPVEKVVGRFGASTRNQINRTYRDSGLSFRTTNRLTDEGYALLCDFLRARGLPAAPHSNYTGCVEFLAFADHVPVSGILLFPSAPVGLVGAIFSHRYRVDEDKEYRRVGNAGKRLMAEVCRWGIEHQLTGIDVGGLNLEASAKAGIAEYKTAFAPTVAQQYVYTYTSPTFQVFERVMARLRALERRILVARNIRTSPGG